MLRVRILTQQEALRTSTRGMRHAVGLSTRTSTAFLSRPARPAAAAPGKAAASRIAAAIATALRALRLQLILQRLPLLLRQHDSLGGEHGQLPVELTIAHVANPFAGGDDVRLGGLVAFEKCAQIANGDTGVALDFLGVIAGVFRDFLERCDLIGGEIDGIGDLRIAPPIGRRQKLQGACRGSRSRHAVVAAATISAAVTSASARIRRRLVIRRLTRDEHQRKKKEQSGGRPHARNYERAAKMLNAAASELTAVRDAVDGARRARP